MGSGSSKPQGSQYVFAAPVSFSPSVVDSLQNSPETQKHRNNTTSEINSDMQKSDSTRQRNLELQIQQRVTAELERIRAEEAQRLAQYTERLTPATDDSNDDTSPSLKEKISSALTSSSSHKDRSNDSVSKEVAELRSKLERRKKLEQSPDAAVEKAKEGLVQCLRLNDRRPLDCWEQVEAFKAEVAKLEQKFVDRALR
ncbi:hypothetical protein E4T48_03409 [Aureobasidium sp. EXF-10727]|nr:hypothetical protein E4T48_03409 [Aureobasidium sp. EXF-10727]